MALLQQRLETKAKRLVRLQMDPDALRRLLAFISGRSRLLDINGMPGTLEYDGQVLTSINVGLMNCMDQPIRG